MLAMKLPVPPSLRGSSVIPTSITGLDLATGCGGLPRGALSLFTSGDLQTLYQLIGRLALRSSMAGLTAALVTPPWRGLPRELCEAPPSETPVLLLHAKEDFLDKVHELVRHNIDLVFFEPPDESSSPSKLEQRLRRLMQNLFFRDTVLVGLAGCAETPLRGSVQHGLLEWSRMIVEAKVVHNNEHAFEKIMVNVLHRGLIKWRAQTSITEREILALTKVKK
jgi:hypothetical protein